MLQLIWESQTSQNNCGLVLRPAARRDLGCRMAASAWNCRAADPRPCAARPALFRDDAGHGYGNGWIADAQAQCDPAEERDRPLHVRHRHVSDRQAYGSCWLIVRCGSPSTHAVEATRPCLSALPRNRHQNQTEQSEAIPLDSCIAANDFVRRGWRSLYGYPRVAITPGRTPQVRASVLRLLRPLSPTPL